MMRYRVAIGCAAAIIGAGVAHAQQHTRGVAMITIKGIVADAPGPFDWLLAPGKAYTLSDYVGLLDEAGQSDEIDAVVVRLKDARLSTTQVQEIGQKMRALSASGTPVHLFAENYGTSEILLSSYADEALIQSGGVVSFPGLYMEEMFLADTLHWIGIEPDFVQIGDYKGASETLMNSEPSPAWDQNISQLLDSMYENMRRMVGEGRGLDPSQLDHAMQELWWTDADEAIELGIVDAAVDLATLGDFLGRELGGEVEWVRDFGVADGPSAADVMANPFAMMRMLMDKPKHRATRNTIAILHINGAIVDGDSSGGGMFGGATTGSRTIRNAIEDIIAQDKIGGVIVRIESPGGSAIASEVIWQGLQRLREHKPVWVSVGSMAASGGYYIAVGGERIFVNPSSIVGSIGVVGGKLAMGGLFEKLRIHVVPRARGPRAELMSTLRPWNDEERAAIRSRMQETYDLFTMRVRQGRAGIDLTRTAEGRLFTGDTAIELAMADEIGSLEDAIEAMGEELGWTRYDIMHFPGPKGFDELIEEALGGFASAPVDRYTRGGVFAEVVSGLRNLLGERTWTTVGAQMEAIMQLRNEPVVLTMPRVLIFR